MPDLPDTPPSIEQLHHEIHKWLTTTSVGREIAEIGVIENVADGFGGHFPDVDSNVLGSILLRCASFLASEKDTPVWMIANLLGAAGVRLRDETADA